MIRFCLLPLFFLILLNYKAAAQQAAQYSLYMLNPYAYNPAYSGLDKSLSLTGVYRTQWSGLAGAPNTQHFNAHMPVYFLGGGMGVMIENDLLGAQRNTAFLATYARHLSLGEHTLSIGIRGGWIQKAFDGSKLLAPGGNYEGGLIDHRDVFLTEGNEQAMTTTVGGGMYFQSDNLDIGISANNLIEPAVDYQLENNTTARILLRRHYFFNAAYNLELSNTLVFRTSVLLKTDFTQSQIDFSGIFVLNDNIMGGVAFRGYNSQTQDAVVLIAGFRLNEKLKVGYAYDLTLSKLKSVSSGSHEILLNYNLNKEIGKGKLPNIIYNPRFL